MPSARAVWNLAALSFAGDAAAGMPTLRLLVFRVATLGAGYGVSNPARPAIAAGLVALARRAKAAP